MAVPALSDDALVVTSLTALRKAENACRRCPLYKNATQAVPGEGSRDAEIMLFGKPMAIGKSRGAMHRLDDGTAAFVTVHPSALLRVQEQADKERQYRDFVADLRRAAAYLRQHAA